MANSNRWYVIINPTSGNGTSKKKWPQIKTHLEYDNFDFDFSFTEHENHSPQLVQEAIQNGFLNIICVGGDGTLHNIVNGIMAQNTVPSNKVNIGMIPIGTGNDWVKTHIIPKDFKKAIEIIKTGTRKVQDLGKIEFLDQDKKPVYFNNLAGVGFDGFVVSKVHKYKHFGAIAYLVGAILGLFRYKNFKAQVSVNSNNIKSKTLMVLIGLCNFSGGGMRLTKNPDPFDCLFDISIAKNIGKVDILKNLTKLFNGKIVNHKKVVALKSDSLIIKIEEEEKPFIQADGELIGKGNVKISIVPKAFSFYSI